jgi:hypothetical protein|tara:strand:- start:859 stop:1098 length:240 start_codon:yes stop_codon:yes gene_type:complete
MTSTISSNQGFYWDSNSSPQDLLSLSNFLINDTIDLLPEDKDIEPFNLQVIKHLVNLIQEGKLTASKIGDHKIRLMLVK